MGSSLHRSEKTLRYAYFFLVGHAVPVMGSLVPAHLPRHPMVGLSTIVGFSATLNAFCAAYGSYDAGSLPFSREAYAFSEVNWLPGIIIPVASCRPVAVPNRPAALAALALGRLDRRREYPTDPGRWDSRCLVPGPQCRHRETDRDAPALFSVLYVVSLLLVGVATIASIASLFVRFRRSHRIERQQLKWFVFAVVPSTFFAPCCYCCRMRTSTTS